MSTTRQLAEPSTLSVLGWLLTTPATGPRIPTWAEGTPADGLAIVPALHPDHGLAQFEGTWDLIHTRSGLPVGVSDVPLAYAREAARYLAVSRLDWRRTPDELVQDLDFGLINRRLHDAHRGAVSTGRPLYWGRASSWRRCPPVWRAVPPLDEDRYEFEWPSYEFESWAEVVEWCDAVDPCCPDSEWCVLRDEAESWELVCAAPLCGDGVPAVLMTSTHNGDRPWRTPDREELVRAATRRAWRSHGRHWMCPRCVVDHQTAEPLKGDVMREAIGATPPPTVDDAELAGGDAVATEETVAVYAAEDAEIGRQEARCDTRSALVAGIAGSMATLLIAANGLLGGVGALGWWSLLVALPLVGALGCWYAAFRIVCHKSLRPYLSGDGTPGSFVRQDHLDELETQTRRAYFKAKVERLSPRILERWQALGTSLQLLLLGLDLAVVAGVAGLVLHQLNASHLI